MIAERTPMLTAKVESLFAEINALEAHWTEKRLPEAVLNRRLSRDETDLKWTDAITSMSLE